MATTSLRRRKDGAYGISPAGSDYYAFWMDGRAGLYKDGIFVSYRATGGPEIGEAPALIHVDSEAIVGPGSIVWRSDVAQLTVWDVDGEATHVYDAEAGWVVTPAVYDGGWLWWGEREAVQHGGVGTHATYFRLVKARADFSDAAVVHTYEAVHHLGFSVLWDPPSGFALTTLGAIVSNHWFDEASGEVQDDLQVRFARAGGSAADNGWPAIGPGTNVAPLDGAGVPLPNGNACGALVFPVGSLASHEDSELASVFALWPDEEEWQAAGNNASLSANGLQGSTYGGVTLVRGPADVVGGGSPIARFTVGPSPDEDEPSYFYIKG